MNSVRSAVAYLAVVFGAALFPLAAAAAAEPGLPITIEYHGTIDETKLIAGTAQHQFHEQWELVYDVQPPLVAPAWHIKMLTGNVSTVVPPPNQSSSCTGTLSDNPNLPVLSYQYTPALESGKTNIVQVNGNAPGLLRSSSPYTPYGFCDNEKLEEGWEEPNPTPHPDPTQAQIDYELGSGAVSKPFEEDWTEAGEQARHFVLKSTLAVNGSAPAIPATPKAVTDAALAALKTELPQAFYPCITAGAGVILFSGGGAIGVVAGGTMVAVASPACAQALVLLANLQKIYRDPPVANYDSIAHVARPHPVKVALPSCSGHGAKLGSSCRRLHSLAIAWIAALQGASVSAQALATTVGRESAASNAHNSAAVALQRKNALRLLPNLRASLRAQGSAGSALASILRRLHVSGALDAAQSAGAIADVEQGLAHRGLATAALETEAGPSLAAKPVDVIRVLASRID